MPRRYCSDERTQNKTLYSSDSASTELLEPQSNYISLNKSGEVDLPIKLNITVIPRADTWKFILKVNALHSSASYFSDNDLKDIQNMFYKMSPHYVKFLGIISVAHVVLTFLSIKNDVKQQDA